MNGSSTVSSFARLFNNANFSDRILCLSLISSGPKPDVKDIVPLDADEDMSIAPASDVSVASVTVLSIKKHKRDSESKDDVAKETNVPSVKRLHVR
jgi:hypothetical protein